MTLGVKGRWLTAFLCIFWASLVPAQGLDQSRWFDIPKLPMESALLVFSEQAGVQILVDARLTQGLESPAVSGYLAPIHVLEVLIDGSPLRARIVSRNTVVLAGGDDKAVLVRLPGID